MVVSTSDGHTAPLVVLIEDDPMIGQMLEEVLDVAGYRVESAEDGQAGLDLVRSVRPSLVLSNLNLPRLDGSQVAQAMKSDPELWSIPIILMSAGSKPNTPNLYSAFVRKPFDLDEILTLIEVETGRQGKPPRAVQ
jgi:DNA-binding response OmpR family regulator